MSEQILTGQLSAGGSLTPEPKSNGWAAQVYKEVSLSVVNGRCVLNRQAFPITDKDFVGVYRNGQIDDPHGSIGTWNWALWTNYPFPAGIDAEPGFVAMYYSYDVLQNKYVRMAVTPPLTTEIIQSGGTVSARTRC